MTRLTAAITASILMISGQAIPSTKAMNVPEEVPTSIVAEVTGSAEAVSIPPVGPQQATDPHSVAPDEVVPGVFGAGTDDRAVIDEALKRFRDTGFPLPLLAITVHADLDGCQGHNGLYRSGGPVEQIDICHVAEHTVLHELAHAWDFNYSTPSARQDFLDATGLLSWSGSDVRWRDRGAERAANLVALVLRDDAGGCQESNWQLVALLSGRGCGEPTRVR